jgi:hypothetical protein
VASSFWCRQGESSESATVTAIVATPRLTMRALPRKLSKPIYREIRRSKIADTDLSLQADAIAVAPIEFAAAASKVTRRQRLFAAAGVILAATLSTGIVVMSIWLLTLAP